MKLLAIVVFSAFWVLHPAANANETVRLSNGEWPPFMSEHYKHYGAASDIVTQAFKLQGIEVQYGFFLWDKSLKLAQTGQWDGSLIWTWNEEREKLFLYSNPVITLRTVFFHRVDTVFDWKDWNDLQGKTVGATKGYYYGEDFKKAEEAGIISVIRQPTDIANFKKLLLRKIDLFVIDTEIGYEILNVRFPVGIKNLITNHPLPARETSFHLLISRKINRGTDLISAFNTGLKELKKNGMYEQILDNVIMGTYRPTSNKPSN
ncbi:substrate-binding periplasmic protein [Spartinivicinus poritis]|uniref:Transporter substrate-binding domain-containing protein n=1 Tax=Spartinivicinus poritis TaxID=2994640 RepID=A0ABT5UF72_9GAMM|nr:transporter substrate-binding domain-containing protein [Spartinivicinus sp. A2-2]MDE1464957.1 transporter substrate-binding domain-containing protein [Spartinivicinus sp. A2-2]